MQEHVVGAFLLQIDSAPGARELAGDQVVRTTRGTDVTQLSAWARVRAQVGYSPLYLFVRQEGRLVGGGSCSIAVSGGWAVLDTSRTAR